MPTPEELGIPVDEWRDGQWELIQHLASSESNINVLQAPPGVGKSVIAIATGRGSDSAVAVLTGTKQLQDQYSSTFTSIVDLRGRSNFPCILTRGLTADEGICTVGEPCEHQYGQPYPACPYYERKAMARDAAEVVTSYSYYLRDSGRHKGALGGRDLLVLDECHELEDHLRGWWSVEVTRRARDVLNLGKPVPSSLAWLQGVRETAHDWLDDNTSIVAGWGTVEPTHRRAFSAVERLSEDLARLVPALEAAPDSWVWEETLGGTIVYKPVLVKDIARDTIFKSARSFLLMSATINPTDLAELGLGADDYTYRSVPSPFPVGNRPLIYWPAAKVRANLSEGELSAWIRRIDTIMEMHPDEKGLIHTANYKLAATLLERGRYSSRLMSHTTSTRATSLEDFRRTSTPMVLVSPSVTTGVDLPYDLCRFQIIGKVAWPYRGDPQVEKRLKMAGGEAWYANRAAGQLGQAYGRGVRAVDDAAVTYLIDGTFEQLLSRWRHLLSSWVREAIIRA